jgi:glycosyltransferase involved in cell wall biosynthesis
MLRLSLIVATYNRAESLITALQSVVEQTAPKEEWECVVVNNNSTDDTAARFKTFAEAHHVVQMRKVG